MVMFQLSGKVTPSSKAILKQAEKLKQQDVIGSGGYGTVYKLVLDDMTAFAVKKLARGGEDRERGFERELETLADIKHRNLVSLRGYYSAPHINILIYDLMPNGNLDTLLHGINLECFTFSGPSRICRLKAMCKVFLVLFECFRNRSLYQSADVKRLVLKASKQLLHHFLP